MGRRSKAALAAVGATTVLAAAACAPYFASGSTLTVTPLGQLARLSWSAALEDDAGETVVEYGIEINGSEVSRFPAASGTSCVLTGLSAGTGYTLSVTAYGSNGGEWSGSYTGDVASLARVSASYTNGTAGAPAGASPTCVAPTDSDGDRIPNALENNNGVFVSAARTGTNPNMADTDVDGIKDGDEVFGTTSGLALYEMGTRPTYKDLLFEYDWFDDATGCAAHSHRPTAAMVNKVKVAFGGLTTTNPNGATGVNVINDYGQGGLFTGGNLIADPDGTLATGVNGAEFGTYKDANFAANREGYFHYVLSAHAYNVNSTSSGQAELPGDDLIVSLGCVAGVTDYVANTIVHEVGHNLNLRHGGDEDTNYMPNYNSVMNYRYQFPGIDTNCDVNPDGVLSYSKGDRRTLNESALVEANGVCVGGPALDWNGNAVFDAAPVAVNLNASYDTVLSTLTDYNDQANLCLTCVTNDGADGASPFSEPEIITEQPRPDAAP